MRVAATRETNALIHRDLIHRDFDTPLMRSLQDVYIPKARLDNVDKLFGWWTL